MLPIVIGAFAVIGLFALLFKFFVNAPDQAFQDKLKELSTHVKTEETKRSDKKDKLPSKKPLKDSTDAREKTKPKAVDSVSAQKEKYQEPSSYRSEKTASSAVKQAADAGSGPSIAPAHTNSEHPASSSAHTHDQAAYTQVERKKQQKKPSPVPSPVSESVPSPAKKVPAPRNRFPSAELPTAPVVAVDNKKKETLSAPKQKKEKDREKAAKPVPEKSAPVRDVDIRHDNSISESAQEVDLLRWSADYQPSDAEELKPQATEWRRVRESDTAVEELRKKLQQLEDEHGREREEHKRKAREYKEDVVRLQKLKESSEQKLMERIRKLEAEIATVQQGGTVVASDDALKQRNYVLAMKEKKEKPEDNVEVQVAEKEGKEAKETVDQRDNKEGRNRRQRKDKDKQKDDVGKAEEPTKEKQVEPSPAEDKKKKARVSTEVTKGDAKAPDDTVPKDVFDKKLVEFAEERKALLDKLKGAAQTSTYYDNLAHSFYSHIGECSKELDALHKSLDSERVQTAKLSQQLRDATTKFQTAEDALKRAHEQSATTTSDSAQQAQRAQQEAQRLGNELANASEKVQTLEREIELVKQERQKAVTDSQEKSKQIDQLASGARELKTQLESAHTDIAKLKEELGQQTNIIADLRGQLNSLHSASDKNLSDVQLQLDAHKSAAQQLRAELEASKNTVNKLNSELTTQQQAVTDLTALLEAERKTSADLRAELNTQKASFEMVKANLIRLLEAERKGADELRAELDTQKKVAEQARSELDAERKNTGQLRADLDAQATAVQRLTSELDAERKAAEDLKARGSSDADSNAQLVADYKAQLAEITTQLDSEKDVVRKLRADLERAATLDTKVADLTSQLDSKTRDHEEVVKKLDTRIASLEQAVQQAEAKAQQATSERDTALSGSADASVRIAQLESEQASLRHSMKSKDEHVASLEHLLSEEKSARHDVLRRLEEVSQRVKELETGGGLKFLLKPGPATPGRGGDASAAAQEPPSPSSTETVSS